MAFWHDAFSLVITFAISFQPSLFGTQEAINGLFLLIGMIGFMTLWATVALIVYLLRGRFAKDNWKNVVDAEEQKETENARVTSLKRKGLQDPKQVVVERV